MGCRNHLREAKTIRIRQQEPVPELKLFLSKAYDLTRLFNQLAGLVGSFPITSDIHPSIHRSYVYERLNIFTADARILTISAGGGGNLVSFCIEV